MSGYSVKVWNLWNFSRGISEGVGVAEGKGRGRERLKSCKADFLRKGPVGCTSPSQPVWPSGKALGW